MIPWIESHTWSLGPLTFQTWGTFVALGFLLGGWLAAKRAKTKGLDPKQIWDFVFWIFVAAFVGARLFHVFAYDLDHYLANPLDAIDPRKPGFAIMGGLIGAAFAFLFIVKKRSLDLLAYADVLVWGLPWGCGVGRIGCFLIHDHPGTLSSSFLAVKYPTGETRHDLGLYLSIVGFLIGCVFLLLNRRHRHPGFFFGAFLVLDSFSRLWLDFYRVVDIRYSGLTPTQWAAIPLMALGIWLMLGRKIPTRTAPQSARSLVVQSEA
ncbi:prolipoprotein diacylglyceryl transferase [Patescibacteria group bacterium]|nr:prolipoprotein diacylglyceryl transferase [Patescibacteria group bacterium]